MFRLRSFLIFHPFSWSGPQVRARSHPNVVSVQAVINAWYEQTKGDGTADTVDLATPLSYADRFRMRHPGVSWNVHPPHVDGLSASLTSTVVANLMSRIISP